MKKSTKSTVLFFLFHFTFWIWFTYITRNGDEWFWKRSVMVSLGYAALMAHMDHRMRKYTQLYLTAGMGEKLTTYLTDQGYEVRKKKDNTTFFKKPGFSWSPFVRTTITESAFYTLINGTNKIIENVPEELERIRQPYTRI